MSIDKKFIEMQMAYEEKIKDLEAKLAESEKERDGNYENYSICWKDIDQLKQQLAEKEKEIEELKDYIGCKGCIDLIAKTRQDKINFAIEKLQEMKKCLFDVWAMGYGEICKYEIEDVFDEKIKELKEGK